MSLPSTLQTSVLTFESLRVRAVSVPLRRPIVSNPKVGVYREWPLILIDLRTKEGIVGRSYLEPYLVSSINYLIPTIRALGTLLEGSSLAPTDVFNASTQSLHLMGREGVSVIASSAIDMAVWDALAQAVDLPLASLLGGAPGKVRAYNTTGLWLQPLHSLAEEAVALVNEGGFSGIKMRLGRPTLQDDVEAVRIVRNAVGIDIKVMSDFNQALSLDEALRRCHRLDDEGLHWFEEPVVFDNFGASAQLAHELKTPVQIGENIYGPRSLYNAITKQAADLYMPDLMRIGGVTGWMRSAAIAGAAGYPLSSHLYTEISAHLLRVSETADWLEWSDWADPVLKEPFELDGGFVTVPNRPGNGIEWNEIAIAKWAI